MFRKLRITILLVILVIVSLGTWWQSKANENWHKSFRLTIYPINADNDPDTSHYINQIKGTDFNEITDFLQSQSSGYNQPAVPSFYLSLGPQLNQLPPAPPVRQTAANMILWSLSLRYWLFKHTRSVGLDSRHIRIFVLYHKLQKGKVLAHSYGLRKGLLGVVNAYAGDIAAGSNKVIITHELLHIFGATDKYDNRNLPVYPDGYAQPDQDPLYPQKQAEIMGGRIPVNQGTAYIPESLEHCVIGPKTASEINWL